MYTYVDVEPVENDLSQPLKRLSMAQPGNNLFFSWEKKNDGYPPWN